MLINCPECGHKVSDKAPVCPHCGIEIAEQAESITNEPNNAGNDEEIVYGEPIVAEPIDNEIPQERKETVTSHIKTNTEGKSKSTLLISFLIALLICAVVLYFYKDALDRQAANPPSQNTALLSDTTEEETPKETEEKEVQTADTASKKPSFSNEIKQLIDSTKNSEKPEAPEAEKKKENDGFKVTQEVEQKAYESVRRFFLAINSKDREKLKACVTKNLAKFDNKQNATSTDVVQYMVDLYQADVTNLNWHLGKEPQVKIVQTGDQYAYKVTVPARKVTERGDIKSERKYQINATVNVDGKITSMTIDKE